MKKGLTALVAIVGLFAMAGLTEAQTFTPQQNNPPVNVQLPAAQVIVNQPAPQVTVTQSSKAVGAAQQVQRLQAPQPIQPVQQFQQIQEVNEVQYSVPVRRVVVSEVRSTPVQVVREVRYAAVAAPVPIQPVQIQPTTTIIHHRLFRTKVTTIDGAGNVTQTSIRR